MVVVGLTSALASEYIKSEKRESIETKHQGRAAKVLRGTEQVPQ